LIVKEKKILTRRNNMGMFNDNVAPNRLGWTYSYLGAELLPHAQRLYTEYFNKEQSARNAMADFMRDMNVSQNDTKVQETKRDITTYGTLKEQCAVFRHEFNRHPGKGYELGLGDVTFFGLTEKHK
jgi:hypothetical protein